MIFFTSDLHFGHARILQYCSRPFLDVEDMHRELVRRWNATVRPEDTVYVLGDFALYLRKREVEDILVLLHGFKILVAGNHDHRDTRNAIGWHQVVRGSIELAIADGPTPLHLIHDPFRLPVEAVGIVLHGHLHGLKGDRGHAPSHPERIYCDVGVDVDAMDYRPISEHEIMRLIHSPARAR